MRTAPDAAVNTHRDLEVEPGVVFRVFDSGARGSAPAVVLVHGIGVSHRYLTRLHARLSRTRRSLMIDLPGYGGLPKPPKDLGIESMARGLSGVLDRLDLGPVVIVGHSMGAQWVVETTRRRPDLVDRAVIIGPVADDRHRTLIAQAAALALDTLGEPPRVAATVVGDYLRCGIPYYLAQCRHMLDYPLEERVRDLERSLLIIRGGRDPIAGPAWCRRLRDAAPDARLIVVPGRPHIVQQSGTNAVLSAMIAHEPAEHHRETM